MGTILIVDDNEIDRELASRCLKSLDNIQITAVGDGNEALQFISRQQPDLVLTDLRMPGIDGLELVGRLRELYPLLPVVLMTSQGSEQIAVRALRSGAASYVPKHDLKAELASTIIQVLGVSESARSRHRILEHLHSQETCFRIPNDPALISPLVGHLQQNLRKINFGDEVILTQIGIALMEALSNALIHGNLEISSRVKSEDRKEFDRLIAHRRHTSPFQERAIDCLARESREKVEYVIRDEGPGFDSTSLPDPTDSENLLKISGRGVMLMRTFMDVVEYNQKGNQVTLVRCRSQEEESEAAEALQPN